MNYTTITINGEKIGLKFGMASFRYLEKKFVEGKSFNNDQINEIGLGHLIYAGYYNNCLIKDVELKYDFEYFVDWVELNLGNEEAVKELVRIVELWSNNNMLKASTNTEAESKKKISRGKK